MRFPASYRAWALPVALSLGLVAGTANVETRPANAAPNAVVARMTASPTPVVDADGNVWTARSSDLVATGTSNKLKDSDVVGTEDDDLYRHNAWGVSRYSTPVPAVGSYHVRLLMAEDNFDDAGRRVFNVAAENLPVVGGIDIFKAVGRSAAYEVSFDAFVSDGRLDLSFSTVKDLALVSAIEVTGGEMQQPGSFDLRVTSAMSTITVDGDAWAPGDGWIGGPKRSTALEGQPIGSTRLDELYRTQMWGMTGWRAQVPHAGTYRVRLFMAEPKYTEVGRRVYDVLAEGKPVLTDVDVFKAVGVRTAYAPSFDVMVDDGYLDLGFINEVDYAAIAAIRVTELGPASQDPGSSHDEGESGAATDPVASADSPGSTNGTVGSDEEGTSSEPGAQSVFISRMVARPEPVTDGQGNRWDRWSPGLGSWRQSKRLDGRPVAGTDEPELYRRNVWGAGGYSLRVAKEAATYRVRLLMAEDSFPTAGRRVFDVKAEGRTVATDVDIAGAVGINHAHDVTFTTQVEDGMLSLDFIKKVDQPLISGIEVISTTAVVPPPAGPHRVFPLSPDSWWYDDISEAPVASNSAATIAALAKDVETRAGGIAGFNAYEYSVGYHVAEAGDRYVTVDRNCNATTWTPGLYDGAAQFLDVPVPGSAVPAVGSDRHMAIYDPRTDKLWSFWQMQRSPATGRWSACWGGRMDDVSKNQGIYAPGYGAAASGLAMPPGMVTQDEVRRGRIDHAVAIVVPNARKDVFSWPANRTDGVSSAPDAVMQGQRLRLDPALNLDAYELTPLARIIAEAAQKYGMVAIDTSGAVAVLAQAGDVEQAQTGTNPWWNLVGDRQWEAMRNFPWNKMQALPKDYGRR